jgi:hypothetical protein
VIGSYSQSVRRLFVTVMAGFALAGGAAADDVTVPLTVRPGSLTLAPTTTASLTTHATVTVVDARGKGAGWRLVGRVTGLGGRRVVISGVDLRCGLRSTCTLPRSRVRYPIVLGVHPVPLLDAARGTGMGSIVVTFRLAFVPSPGTGLGFSVRTG